jgi:hypothetical protein
MTGALGVTYGEGPYSMSRGAWYHSSLYECFAHRAWP